MKDTLRPAIVALLVFTVLCGFLYPLAMVGLAAVIPKPPVSALIGQSFDDPAYFWSRPTARAGYDATSSTGTNQGESGFVDQQGHLGANPALAKTAADRIAALHGADPGNTAPVPVDLVTSSASGLDPDISPAAAYYQVPRVAHRRGKTDAEIRALVAAHVEDRTLGILGEPRVNVVLLNQALDRVSAPPQQR